MSQVSQRSAPAWVTAAGVLLLSSCGNALYAACVTQASQELARAEQLDAARRAPYDYYYALEHLRKARSEASEADYADATALAETAYQHANRAVQISQRVAPAEASLPLDPP